MQHVRDTLKHPNKDNKGILYAASQRTPPVDSVYVGGDSGALMNM